MIPVVILRPEPGCSETAARAAAIGLATIIAPLFTVRALDWSPPDPAAADALMMTSANAARHGGEGLALYRHLPLYAVGEASAAAARAAGFARVLAGVGDADALLDRIATGPHRRILHLCGQHRRAPLRLALAVHDISVYVSQAVEALPDALLAIAGVTSGAPATVLLHSPRAAKHFRRLADAASLDIANVSIVAISQAAATAAGPDWHEVHVARQPTDAAMLAVARFLCETPQP